MTSVGGGAYRIEDVSAGGGMPGSTMSRGRTSKSRSPDGRGQDLVPVAANSSRMATGGNGSAARMGASSRLVAFNGGGRAPAASRKAGAGTSGPQAEVLRLMADHVAEHKRRLEKVEKFNDAMVPTRGWQWYHTFGLLVYTLSVAAVATSIGGLFVSSLYGARPAVGMDGIALGGGSSGEEPAVVVVADADHSHIHVRATKESSATLLVGDDTGVMVGGDCSYMKVLGREDEFVPASICSNDGVLTLTGAGGGYTTGDATGRRLQAGESWGSGPAVGLGGWATGGATASGEEEEAAGGGHKRVLQGATGPPTKAALRVDGLVEVSAGLTVLAEPLEVTGMLLVEPAQRNMVVGSSDRNLPPATFNVYGSMFSNRLTVEGSSFLNGPLKVTRGNLIIEELGTFGRMSVDGETTLKGATTTIGDGEPDSDKLNILSETVVTGMVNLRSDVVIGVEPGSGRRRAQAGGEPEPEPEPTISILSEAFFESEVSLSANINVAGDFYTPVFNTMTGEKQVQLPPIPPPRHPTHLFFPCGWDEPVKVCMNASVYLAPPEVNWTAHFLHLDSVLDIGTDPLCEDDLNGTLGGLGFTCDTAIAAVDCDFDMSTNAPALPSGTYVRELCPVSCNNCPCRLPWCVDAAEQARRIAAALAGAANVTVNATRDKELLYLSIANELGALHGVDPDRITILNFVNETREHGIPEVKIDYRLAPDPFGHVMDDYWSTYGSVIPTELLAELTMQDSSEFDLMVCASTIVQQDLNGTNATNSTKECVAMDVAACLAVGTAGTNTCTEMAGTPVAADTVACAAVSALDDSTACVAVMLDCGSTISGSCAAGCTDPSVIYGSLGAGAACTGVSTALACTYAAAVVGGDCVAAGACTYDGTDDVPEACNAPTCTFTAGDASSCTGTAGCSYTADDANTASIDEEACAAPTCTFTAGDASSCTGTAGCAYVTPVTGFCLATDVAACSGAVVSEQWYPQEQIWYPVDPATSNTNCLAAGACTYATIGENLTLLNLNALLNSSLLNITNQTTAQWANLTLEPANCTVAVPYEDIYGPPPPPQVNFETRSVTDVYLTGDTTVTSSFSASNKVTLGGPPSKPCRTNGIDYQCVVDIIAPAMLTMSLTVAGHTDVTSVTADSIDTPLINYGTGTAGSLIVGGTVSDIPVMYSHQPLMTVGGAMLLGSVRMGLRSSNRHSITGDVLVAGKSTLQGNVVLGAMGTAYRADIYSHARFFSDVTVSGSMQLGDTSSQSLVVTGYALVQGPSELQGDVVLNANSQNTLTVKGETSLEQPVRLRETLNVQGNTVIGANSDTTLIAFAHTNLQSGLNVAGDVVIGTEPPGFDYHYLGAPAPPPELVVEYGFRTCTAEVGGMGYACSRCDVTTNGWQVLDAVPASCGTTPLRDCASQDANQLVCEVGMNGACLWTAADGTAPATCRTTGVLACALADVDPDLDVASCTGATYTPTCAYEAANIGCPAGCLDDGTTCSGTATSPIGSCAFNPWTSNTDVTVSLSGCFDAAVVPSPATCTGTATYIPDSCDATDPNAVQATIDSCSAVNNVLDCFLLGAATCTFTPWRQPNCEVGFQIAADTLAHSCPLGCGYVAEVVAPLADITYVPDHVTVSVPTDGQGLMGYTADVWLNDKGTCIETAGVSVPEDALTCVAVAYLADSTACDLVMLVADGVTSACTYTTVLAQPSSLGVNLATLPGFRRRNSVLWGFIVDGTYVPPPPPKEEHVHIKTTMTKDLNVYGSTFMQNLSATNVYFPNGARIGTPGVVNQRVDLYADTSVIGAFMVDNDVELAANGNSQVTVGSNTLVNADFTATGAIDLGVSTLDQAHVEGDTQIDGVSVLNGHVTLGDDEFDLTTVKSRATYESDVHFTGADFTVDHSTQLGSTPADELLVNATAYMFSGLDAHGQVDVYPLSSCTAHVSGSGLVPFACAQPADLDTDCPSNLDYCLFTLGGVCGAPYASTFLIESTCTTAGGTWTPNTQGSCALSLQVGTEVLPGCDTAIDAYQQPEYVAPVDEACTLTLGTAPQETTAATTCTLTSVDAAANPAVVGSCAVATGSGSCAYVAPVVSSNVWQDPEKVSDGAGCLALKCVFWSSDVTIRPPTSMTSSLAVAGDVTLGSSEFTDFFGVLPHVPATLTQIKGTTEMLDTLTVKKAMAAEGDISVIDGGCRYNCIQEVRIDAQHGGLSTTGDVVVGGILNPNTVLRLGSMMEVNVINDRSASGGSNSGVTIEGITIHNGGFERATVDTLTEFTLNHGVDIEGILFRDGVIALESQLPGMSSKGQLDVLTLTNSGNSDDMDGTESSLLFRQFYYDPSIIPSSDPQMDAVNAKEGGKLVVGTETDWTQIATSRDSYMAMHVSTDGVSYERLRVNSNGDVTLPGSTGSTNIRLSSESGDIDASGNINLYGADAGKSGIFFQDKFGIDLLDDGVTLKVSSDQNDQFMVWDMGITGTIDVVAKKVSFDFEEELHLKSDLRIGGVMWFNDDPEAFQLEQVSTDLILVSGGTCSDVAQLRKTDCDGVAGAWTVTGELHADVRQSTFYGNVVLQSDPTVGSSFVAGFGLSDGAESFLMDKDITTGDIMWRYTADITQVVAPVDEACTLTLGTAPQETTAATTCTLTSVDAAANPAVVGSCAVATGSGSCAYVAPVVGATPTYVDLASMTQAGTFTLSAGNLVVGDGTAAVNAFDVDVAAVETTVRNQINIKSLDSVNTASMLLNSATIPELIVSTDATSGTIALNPGGTTGFLKVRDVFSLQGSDGATEIAGNVQIGGLAAQAPGAASTVTVSSGNVVEKSEVVLSDGTDSFSITKHNRNTKPYMAIVSSKVNGVVEIAPGETTGEFRVNYDRMVVAASSGDVTVRGDITMGAVASGFCATDATDARTMDCIFPFSYSGSTYNVCDATHGCATRVDETGEATSLGTAATCQACAEGARQLSVLSGDGTAGITVSGTSGGNPYGQLQLGTAHSLTSSLTTMTMATTATAGTYEIIPGASGAFKVYGDKFRISGPNADVVGHGAWSVGELSENGASSLSVISPDDAATFTVNAAAAGQTASGVFGSAGAHALTVSQTDGSACIAGTGSVELSSTGGMLISSNTGVSASLIFDAAASATGGAVVTTNAKTTMEQVGHNFAVACQLGDILLSGQNLKMGVDKFTVDGTTGDTFVKGELMVGLTGSVLGSASAVMDFATSANTFKFTTVNDFVVTSATVDANFWVKPGTGTGQFKVGDNFLVKGATGDTEIAGELTVGDLTGDHVMTDLSTPDTSILAIGAVNNGGTSKIRMGKTGSSQFELTQTNAQLSIASTDNTGTLQMSAGQVGMTIPAGNSLAVNMDQFVLIDGAATFSGDMTVGIAAVAGARQLTVSSAGAAATATIASAATFDAKLLFTTADASTAGAKLVQNGNAFTLTSLDNDGTITLTPGSDAAAALYVTSDTKVEEGTNKIHLGVSSAAAGAVVTLSDATGSESTVTQRSDTLTVSCVDGTDGTVNVETGDSFKVNTDDVVVTTATKEVATAGDVTVGGTAAATGAGTRTMTVTSPDDHVKLLLKPVDLTKDASIVFGRNTLDTWTVSKVGDVLRASAAGTSTDIDFEPNGVLSVGGSSIFSVTAATGNIATAGDASIGCAACAGERRLTVASSDEHVYVDLTPTDTTKAVAVSLGDSGNRFEIRQTSHTLRLTAASADSTLELLPGASLGQTLTVGESKFVIDVPTGSTTLQGDLTLGGNPVQLTHTGTKSITVSSYDDDVTMTLTAGVGADTTIVLGERASTDAFTLQRVGTVLSLLSGATAGTLKVNPGLGGSMELGYQSDGTTPVLLLGLAAATPLLSLRGDLTVGGASATGDRAIELSSSDAAVSLTSTGVTGATLSMTSTGTGAPTAVTFAAADAASLTLRGDGTGAAVMTVESVGGAASLSVTPGDLNSAATLSLGTSGEGVVATALGTTVTLAHQHTSGVIAIDVGTTSGGKLDVASGLLTVNPPGTTGAGVSTLGVVATSGDLIVTGALTMNALALPTAQVSGTTGMTINKPTGKISNPSSSLGRIERTGTGTQLVVPQETLTLSNNLITATSVVIASVTTQCSGDTVVLIAEIVTTTGQVVFAINNAGIDACVNQVYTIAFAVLS